MIGNSYTILSSYDKPIETTQEVDGYGVPFSPEAQRRHWEYVIAGISQPLIKQVALDQQEWKDKPAGHYNKGSGI